MPRRGVGGFYLRGGTGQELQFQVPNESRGRPLSVNSPRLMLPVHCETRKPVADVR